MNPCYLATMRLFWAGLLCVACGGGAASTTFSDPPEGDPPHAMAGAAGTLEKPVVTSGSGGVVAGSGGQVSPSAGTGGESANAGTTSIGGGGSSSAGTGGVPMGNTAGTSAGSSTTAGTGGVAPTCGEGFTTYVVQPGFCLAAGVYAWRDDPTKAYVESGDPCEPKSSSWLSVRPGVNGEPITISVRVSPDAPAEIKVVENDEGPADGKVFCGNLAIGVSYN